ncbi:MAG: hypothetical protein ABI627_26770 [Polyangiaceae bacterium]
MQRSSDFDFMKSRIALASLSVLLLVACQVAFGDFTIDVSRLAVSCETGASRCLGNQIQICAGGDEWTVLGTCSSPDLCDLRSLSCAPCVPGTSQCNGSQPQLCDPNQHWSVAGPACASASLCEVPGDGSAAICRAPGCPAAGQMQCSDSDAVHTGGGATHLQRCPLSQKAWQDVEVCVSKTQCSVEQANAEVAAGKPATCSLPKCIPGQFNCDTGSPRPCNADGTDWDVATTSCTAGTCNPGKGDCSACVPGAAACSGSNLEQCSDQATLTSTPCHSALACNAGAAPGCDPATCTPGEFRCDTSALERCRSDGTKWELVEQCRNGVLCNRNETSCELPNCPTAGAMRCQGDTQQQCRDNLTGWDVVKKCPIPGSCDPELGCLTTPCTSGTFRCNDVSLEACNNSAWVRQEDCATSALCDVTQRLCTAPTCDAGARQCQGNVLLRCTANRDGWEEIDTCSDGLMCNPATKRCE